MGLFSCSQSTNKHWLWGGGGGREAGSACVGGCGSLLELCADAVHAGSVRRQMMGGENGLLEVSSKGCFE